MLQISQSVLFHLTENTVCGPAEASQRHVKCKRGRKTLPQQFQVLIPDMMVFFHFLSKLIVLLSELLTESLEKQKSQYLAPVCIMKSTFSFKIFRETLSRKQLPLIRKVGKGRGRSGKMCVGDRVQLSHLFGTLHKHGTIIQLFSAQTDDFARKVCEKNMTKSLQILRYFWTFVNKNLCCVSWVVMPFH